jgi:hypothetical protein
LNYFHKKKKIIVIMCNVTQEWQQDDVDDWEDYDDEDYDDEDYDDDEMDYHERGIHDWSDDVDVAENRSESGSEDNSSGSPWEEVQVGFRRIT